MAASALPVRGAWTGADMKYWTRSKWERYSQNVPVSFWLERGKVVRFTMSSTYRYYNSCAYIARR